MKLKSNREFVSLLQNKTTTISFQRGFRRMVEPDWVLERTISQHILYFPLKHSFLARIGEKQMEIVPGSFFWVSPHVHHRFSLLSSKQRLQKFFLILDIEYRKKPIRLPQDFYIAPNAWSLMAKVEECIDEFSMNMEYADERIRSLCVLLFTYLLREQKRPNSPRVLNSNQRFQIRERIDRDLKNGLTSKELANELGLNTDYFTRLFRNTYGEAPRVWLSHERIRRVASLLPRSNKSISEIALSEGFEDYYHFCKLFKKVIGVPPKIYRKSGV